MAQAPGLVRVRGGSGPDEMARRWLQNEALDIAVRRRVELLAVWSGAVHAREICLWKKMAACNW